MSSATPTVLVWGHSFIKRLRKDLSLGFDSRARQDFNLHGSAVVHLFGIGGRTVPKLREYDLHALERFLPQIVLLEIGTNDLSHASPEVVAKEIVDFVSFLVSRQFVHVVGICHLIPRTGSFTHVDFNKLNRSAKILNANVKIALEPFSNVFCWSHRGFTEPSDELYLPDGVHVNSDGQYVLYRSYRGAILHALQMFF